MKWIATGLLLLAGVVYAGATALEGRYPWLFFVAAAAEAAMIGAIADWFAVVALFHHPLNLRFIPHTAIVPRNRARIAQGLSEFIQQNLLSAEAVMARIRAVRPAQMLCGWLLRPENAAMLAGYFARIVAFGLTVVDDERVRRFVGATLSENLRRVDVAGAAAQLLDLLTRDARHHVLLDAALAALDDLLAREETRRTIATEVAQNAPALLRTINRVFDLKLDEKAALRIVAMALAKISEVRADRQHELRKRFDAAVAAFIARLKDDPATRAKVERLRHELLENPALTEYLGGLWQTLRGWLEADLRGARSQVEARAAELIGRLAVKLAADPGVQAWLDEQILAAAPGLVKEHRARFGRFVEDQINAWEQEKLVAELERHIGPDLQYIRINGTLVGALVGLLIAAATALVR